MKSEFPRKSHFVLWQRKYEREVLRYEAGAPNTRRHHGQDQLALDAATESVLSLLEKPFCLDGGFLSPAHGSLPPGLLLHVSHGLVPSSGPFTLCALCSSMPLKASVLLMGFRDHLPQRWFGPAVAITEHGQGCLWSQKLDLIFTPPPLTMGRPSLELILSKLSEVENMPEWMMEF